MAPFIGWVEFILLRMYTAEPLNAFGCFLGMKTIVIAGASGFVGENLNAFFTLKGWRVCSIGRANADATWSDQSSIIRVLENADALVNLSGKSVNCRFTHKNVQELITSRVHTTSALGDAIALCKNPPPIWINASGASIYREDVKSANTEDSPVDGTGTMAQVARLWEHAFNECQTPHTRKVALRISLVLGNSGGVYPTFRMLTRMLQGGPQGDGSQMMSWIHITDLLRLVYTLVNHKNPPAEVNAAAPQPLTNKIFMQQFRSNLKVGFGIGAPAWLIKLGTALLGVDSELVLRGMHVVSARTQALEFQFEYPTLDAALSNLGDKNA
jgi:uncharacterized protein (TIGR01777 family)